MPEHGAECPRDGVLGDVFTIGGEDSGIQCGIAGALRGGGDSQTLPPFIQLFRLNAVPLHHLKKLCLYDSSLLC